MCAITLCLQEYLVLIAQLEAQFRKGKLTLQKVRRYPYLSLDNGSLAYQRIDG